MAYSTRPQLKNCDVSIETLIVDADGKLAATEAAHRVAFNLEFERDLLGVVWWPAQHPEPPKITSGKERVGRHTDQLELGAAEVPMAAR